MRFVAGDFQVASTLGERADESFAFGARAPFIVGESGDGLVGAELEEALDNLQYADAGDLAQGDVTVVGQRERARFLFGRALSVAYLFALASASTKVALNNNTNAGKDLVFHQSMVAFNIRFAIGTIANAANFANWANANLPDRCFVGLETALAVGAYATGLKLALHSLNRDTFIKRRNTAMLLPYIGCSLWYTANQLAYLNLLAGPVFWFHNTRFSSFEAPFSNTVTASEHGPSVGGALGAEFHYTLPQLLGITTAALTIGAWAAYMPPVEMNAVSSATSFTYRAHLAAAWIVLARLGLIIPF